MVRHNEKTIHSWHKDCNESGEFTESMKGKYCRPYIMDDENCWKKPLPGCMIEPTQNTNQV